MGIDVSTRNTNDVPIKNKIASNDTGATERIQ